MLGRGLVFLWSIMLWPTFACDVETEKSKLKEYQWVTEDYPPYNYRDQQGNLVGISTDIIVLVYRELSIPLNTKKIIILPWARLFYNLENYEKFAAFTMMKTSTRAKKFNLVTFPLKSKVSIMVLQKNYPVLVVKKLSELTIAVVRADIGEQLLNSTNLAIKPIPTTNANSMLKMLVHQRVDAIAYVEAVAMFQFNKLDFKDKHLVPLYPLNNGSTPAFVFHKNTPKCVTQLFTQTLRKLEQQDDLARIWQKYIH